MVKIYNSIYDEELNSIPSRTKLFIKSIEDDYSIANHDYGIAITPGETGTLFIVDEWLIPQIGKLLFIDGSLVVKEGEKLIPPIKTQKELMMDELQRQMAEVQAMPDEPADIEENTELPVEEPSDGPLLLENTEPSE